MARSTLSDLIGIVRGMTEAGTDDYSITAGSRILIYWTDDQVQTVLDRHRVDVYREQLGAIPKYVSGAVLQHFEYYSNHKNFEQTDGGTAIFIVEDSSGADQGTASWSADYQRGRVIFNQSQAGAIYYLTGRSYDLHAAAADIWRQKASHYSVSQFDFSTDNMRVNRSQVVRQCRDMAEYYDSLAQPQVTLMYRSDIDPEALV